MKAIFRIRLTDNVRLLAYSKLIGTEFQQILYGTDTVGF